MKHSPGQYVNLLSSLLEKNSQKEYSLQMQKYMKNLFPFYGIKSPERKVIFRQFIKDEGFPSIKEVKEVIKLLYQKPEREFHYFAIELANKYSGKFDKEDIKLFEYLIVNYSWWDTIDSIAVNSLGKFFRIHPEMITETTALWMESGNKWLQRSCILFQLKYKKDTDLQLLYSFIDKLRLSNEFFIQKAIGWSLREYSKVDPQEIIMYIRNNELKSLSSREAQRIMIKRGLL